MAVHYCMHVLISCPLLNREQTTGHILVGNIKNYCSTVFISTTVLLCTIVLPVLFFSFSASKDRALITQELIELETSRFHRKTCLITPSNLFWSNITVWLFIMIILIVTRKIMKFLMVVHYYKYMFNHFCSFWAKSWRKRTLQGPMSYLQFLRRSKDIWGYQSQRTP